MPVPDWKALLGLSCDLTDLFGMTRWSVSRTGSRRTNSRIGTTPRQQSTTLMILYRDYSNLQYIQRRYIKLSKSVKDPTALENSPISLLNQFYHHSIISSILIHLLIFINKLLHFTISTLESPSFSTSNFNMQFSKTLFLVAAFASSALAAVSNHRIAFSHIINIPVFLSANSLFPLVPNGARQHRPKLLLGRQLWRGRLPTPGRWSCMHQRS